MAPPKEPRPLPPQSDELKEFYQAYLQWVKDGAPNNESFDRGLGICSCIFNYAVAMGAFITSQSGACPDYELPDFNKFLWKRSLIFQDERFRGNK